MLDSEFNVPFRKSLICTPTLQPWHIMPQLKLPFTYIHWEEDAVRCSDAYCLGCNDDDSAEVFKGYWHSWRDNFEVHCTGLLGNPNPLLRQRYSQVLQNCGNVMLWKARNIGFFFLSLSPGETRSIVLDNYDRFFRVSKNQLYRNSICPEISYEKN